MTPNHPHPPLPGLSLAVAVAAFVPVVVWVPGVAQACSFKCYKGTPGNLEKECCDDEFCGYLKVGGVQAHDCGDCSKAPAECEGVIRKTKENGGKWCHSDKTGRVCFCTSELCNGPGSAAAAAALARTGGEEGQKGDFKALLALISHADDGKGAGSGGNNPTDFTNCWATYSVTLFAAAATLVAVVREM